MLLFGRKILFLKFLLHTEGTQIYLLFAIMDIGKVSLQLNHQLLKILKLFVPKYACSLCMASHLIDSDLL